MKNILLIILTLSFNLVISSTEKEIIKTNFEKNYVKTSLYNSNNPVIPFNNPSIDLLKTATVDAGVDGIINAGDIITYTFIVTNTGDVDLTNVVVTDPLLLAPNGTLTGGPIALLQVGFNDTTTFVGTYVIQQSDIDNGEVVNSATATGQDPNGDDVTDISDDPTDPTDADPDMDGDPDDPTIVYLPSPKLSLIKSITSVGDTNGNGVTDEGDTINYVFTVNNTGNVELENITITDPLLTGANGTLTGGPITNLPVNGSDSTTFTGTYVISASDMAVGYVENSATVMASAPYLVDGSPNPNGPIDVSDVSDTGTDTDGNTIVNPENTETQNSPNGDTTDDPTVLNLPCIIPELTILNMECEADGTVTIYYTTNANVISSNVGTAVSNFISGIPAGSYVIINATTGSCSVSIATTAIAVCPENISCDIELSIGQPIYGIGIGEYSVSFATNVDHTEITMTGGIINGNTMTSALGVDITLIATSSSDATCTRTYTVNSDALDNTLLCANPAVSIGGTECAIDGSAFYTIFYTAAANTLVTSTAGTVVAVDVAGNGSITDIPEGTTVTVTGILDGCVTSQDLIVPAPDCFDDDGDGVTNSSEPTTSTDPCLPVQAPGYTGYNQYNVIWQQADCDNDGINNATEVILGSDPYSVHNTINGTVLYDADNNGCDTNDNPFPNVRLDLTGGTSPESTFVDTAGNYGFYPLAGTFTVTPNIENPSLFTITPVNTTVNFPDANNNSSTQDFCITANGIGPDVEIVIAPTQPARPGFNAEYVITYKNKGNQTLAGDFTLNYDDSVLDYVSATTTPTTQTTGFLNWNYTNLQPFESRSVYVVLNVNGPMESPAINIGDILNFTVEINPIAGDVSPDDNTFNYTQTVIGSYDPNNIICVEGDTLAPAEIGEYLHYVVNFENTGNAFAQNIVVKIEVDASMFDINTLRVLSSSHNAEVRITGDIVEIIFQSIYLSSGGHGNILLKIQSQGNLQTNDTVTKKADIFFDYNFPIETNNANTIYQETLSNPEFNIDNSLAIYPNPVKNSFTIKTDNNIKNVSILDVQGRLIVAKNPNSKEIKIDLTNKANGVYFARITTEKGTSIEKIIKQ